MLGASCGPPQTPVPTGPPRIHFDETEIDLGEIRDRQEPYTAEFFFVNRGLSTLKIPILEPSCTCLGASVSQAELAPGESGVVSVVVQPEQAEAKSTSVVVCSNDAAHPRVRLDVAWRAIAPIEFSPATLNFGVVRPSTSVTQQIAVIQRSDDQTASHCRLLSTTSASTALNPVLINSEAGTSLEVTLSAGTMSGSHTGSVRAQLKDCWAHEITLPVEWTVRDEIEVAPKDMMIGFGAPGRLLRQQLIVTCDPDKRLNVAEVSVNNLSWVDATVESTNEQLSIIRISAQLPDQSGTHRGELSIHRTAPTDRTVVVPLTAVVRDAGDDLHATSSAEATE